MPADGTALATFSSGLLTEAITSPGHVTTDFRRQNWIGNVSEDARICYVWHTTGVSNWQDFLARKQVVFSASAPGTAGYVDAAMLRDLFGVHLRQINGYPGSAEMRLAVEKGEVDGSCGGWTAMPDNWLSEYKINVIVRLSPTLVPGMDNSVPFAGDLVKSERERAIFDFLVAPEKLGRLFMASERVPADRVAMLRRAFDAMVADPAFRQDAGKMRLTVTPMSGAEGDARDRRALRHAARRGRKSQNNRRGMNNSANLILRRERSEPRRMLLRCSGHVLRGSPCGRAPQDADGEISMHHDRRRAHAFPLDQAKQSSGVRGLQPHAAMRHRTAEPRGLVGTVNGDAAAEKDRVRHRRVMVFAREPARREPLRMIDTTRRRQGAATGRYPPVVAWYAVDDDLHGLRRAVDAHDDCRIGTICGEEGDEQRGQ